MTDTEYRRLLIALAGKHLRLPPSSDQEADLGSAFNHAAHAVRLLNVVKGQEDPALLNRLADELEDSPVSRAINHMELSGILDALDDAHDLVLGELRQSAIPQVEVQFLRNAGFDTHEIEVLLMLAVHRAHVLAVSRKLPSDIAQEAAQALSIVLPALRSSAPDLQPAKRKRKILNGIGKLLGGAVAGLGNTLLLTGTLAAPNPATAYMAIASGGVAVSSFFAGLGDLQGE